ncbi:beta-galactosidase [Paenibacillus sp. FSL R7-0273]|uniref:beta-galactosidase n=1 Tax=Paenibacillus sp. FSL R7-0273 TaxID=1536772 RepID=UPI000A68B6BA|nr:beta-galactosidase [Paenibacillus sp. FSL R7-0273]
MMASSFQLSGEWFDTGPHAQLTLSPSGGFRLWTSPEGGGAELQPGKADAAEWQACRYVNAEVYHECHDILVLLFSFRDRDDREITYHLGILPGVRTVICLPLEHLSGEKLFLPRYPGVMQTVLRGGARVDRDQITGFSIATIPSAAERSADILGLCLSKEEPAFDYIYQPYVDELGQLKGREWPGKTADAAELVSRLRAERQRATEWAETAGADYSAGSLSRYGGWKELRFTATGYFRTAFDGRNWWFVDPDGYALFSTGMDCVGPSSPMRVTGMEHLLPQLPGQGGAYKDAWSQEGREFSFGIANLIRVFGPQWRDAWTELTEYRLRQGGFNTIGNWSDSRFIAASNLPYVYPLSGFPETEQRIFRDFPDVFSPEYGRNAQQFAEQLLPLREERRMVGYFMRNEPHWAFVDSLDLTQLMLSSATRFASKERFIQWLHEKYSTVDELNAAWNSRYNGYDELYIPDDTKPLADSVRAADYGQFNRLLIRRYVELPARACREAAPNHLNLGMRYAWVSSDEVLEGCEWFDVFSLNCYQFAPDREQIEQISSRLGKPVMIGEYHFGGADSGMLAYGIRAVATQEERGGAYRYFVEQSAAIPQLIGVHYFQWNDQPVLGRFDGENYQIGAADVCNQLYEPFMQGAIEAHKQMYKVRTGTAEPYHVLPAEIPRTGF